MKGTTMNTSPVMAAKTPLSVLTKLGRSMMTPTAYTMDSIPDTIRMYSAIPLPSADTSPPSANSISADTTKRRADTIATPLNILLSSAPMP